MREVAPKTESISELLLCFAGPMVWAAHFFVMYGVEALICTGPIAPSDNRYFQPVPIAATVLALVSLLCFLTWQWAWSMRDEPERGVGDGLRFLRRTSTALAALATLGVLWTALPTALLPACAGPPLT
jgi:hypothetical protein